MSGIAPILDRIATIEARFTRPAPPAQQALGATALGRTAATTVGARPSDPFDQAMAAAEAAFPGAAGGRTSALPPGLELISANDGHAHAHDHAHADEPTDAATATATWATAPAAPAVAAGARPLDGGATSGGVPIGTPFATEFTRSEAQHGVPPRMLAAVGWVESRYDIGALSPDGAIGVMQLMPGTAAELGVDPHDPSAAIDGAARLLRSHHDRFGSWDLALAAYFSGAGAVSRNGNQAPPRGAEYAQRVIQRMENS